MIINQQISREKIWRVTNPRIVYQGGDKKHSVNGYSGGTVSTTKSKVVGYSRRQLLKGKCSKRIGNYLSSKFEVNGFIKPGVGFEKIVGKTIMGSSRLTNSDVLVCNGGANIVYSSNSNKIILQIMKFFQDNDKAYIIMLDNPHRYDLSGNSYVSKEIKTFNSKLKKITKLFKHATVLEFRCE